MVFPDKPSRNDFPSDEKGGRQYLVSLLRYTFWLILIFGFVFGVSFVFFLRENPSHQMIDLRGRDILEAVEWLQQRSLRPLISERIDPQFPRYQVIEQSPAPGSSVKENRTVSLVVSFGENALVMPQYRGSNYNQAYQSLLAYLSGYEGIPRVTKVEKYSDLAEGLVVDHYPRYQQPINLKERFIFVVSRGIATNQLITGNYLNQEYLETEEFLLSYGIRVTAQYLSSLDKRLAGRIVEQSLPPETPLQPGDTIRFTVGFYDPQTARSVESGKTRDLEVIRLYRLRVPSLSTLDEFVRNLDDMQEVFFSPTNQNGDSLQRTRSVLIKIDDQNGSRILLNDQLNSGEEMDFPYRTLGKGRLSILIDGQEFDTVYFD